MLSAESLLANSASQCPPRPPRPHHVAYAVADFYARHCAERPLDDGLADAVLALLMQRHLPGSEVVDGLAVSPEGVRPYAWVWHEGQDYDPASLARRIRGHAEQEYRLERRGREDNFAHSARQQHFADAAAILQEPELAAFVVPRCRACQGQSHAHTYDENCQSLWAFKKLLARAGGRECSCSPWGSRGPDNPMAHPRQRLHWQCAACRRSLVERARWGLAGDDWGKAMAIYKLGQALRSGELESFCPPPPPSPFLAAPVRS